MPTKIHRPSVPTIESAPTAGAIQPGVNTPDATSPETTPLAIAVVLALMLHVASGVMLDRSHASQFSKAFDDCVTCPAEVNPQQPSLPYD